MIIWLASYPKSGNTWVRSFLTYILYKKKYGDLRTLQLIDQYPKRSHFKNLITDFNNFENISKNWIKSQNQINNDNKIKFLKTHHALCNLKGNFFTNMQNTLGAIYIVRDPRNVLISVHNHFSKENYDEARDFIFDENKMIGFNKDSKNKKKFEDNEIATIISSWKTHYRSWKLMNKNFLLIKYEDLLNKPKEEFNKIAKYVSKFTNTTYSDSLINDAIKENSFENLKKKEEKFGFIEAPFDPKSGKKKKFFYLGPKNNWQNVVDKKIINEMNKRFENEMKELGYL